MKLHQSLFMRTPRSTQPGLPSPRELQAWRTALSACHGVTALMVDLPSAFIAMPSSRPLHKHVLRSTPEAPGAGDSSALIDAAAWPITPQQVDAVMLSWSTQTIAYQPRVLTEIDLCLADDGRVLLHIAPAYLAQWCRCGMAQAQALGWQLQQQYWGDHRRLSFMPPVLARQWAAPWQRYLPMAQWCVQLWQKKTTSLIPLHARSTRSSPSWSGAWSAQQHAHLRLKRKTHD